MDMSEIESYTRLGRHRMLRVDVSFVPEVTGLLRIVEIYDGFVAEVSFVSSREFYFYGLDEGGLCSYRGAYKSLQDLVSDLENYLGKSLSDWTNFNKGFETPEPVDCAPEARVYTANPLLPQGTPYDRQGGVVEYFLPDEDDY